MEYKIRGNMVTTSIEGHQQDIEKESSMLSEAMLSQEEIDWMCWEEHKKKLAVENEITAEWYMMVYQ